MAGALEGLTVTPMEAWAGPLVELGLDVNRKLLALQVTGLFCYIALMQECR
jgi:hypothetical protein